MSDRQAAINFVSDALHSCCPMKGVAAMFPAPQGILYCGPPNYCIPHHNPWAFITGHEYYGDTSPLFGYSLIYPIAYTSSQDLVDTIGHEASHQHYRGNKDPDPKDKPGGYHYAAGSRSWHCFNLLDCDPGCKECQ
jgi:hypothetical protein